MLRIPNVVSGKVDHTDLKFAELPAKELNQLRLAPGDILLIRSNGSASLVGRTAVVREAEKDFAYAGYLIRLRPNRTKVEPEFLNLVLASFDVRLQIELEARSTSGVNNINSGEVQALLFQLPPLLEQQEIVRRVERLSRWSTSLKRGWRRRSGRWTRSRPRSSPAPSAATWCRRIQTTDWHPRC